MKALSLSPLLLSLAAAAAVQPAKVNYNGFKVFRVPTGGDLDAEEQIENVAAHILNPGRPEVDVVVAPEQVDAFNALSFNSSLINEDLGATLAEEGPLVDFETAADDFEIAAVPPESWFTAYHPYAAHSTFLSDLQGSFPGNSELITAGSSVQGRVIRGIHIWGSGGRGSRRAVVFHGNVHAREWISSMNVEYFAYQLLTRAGSDSSIRALRDKFDYYLFPIVNPDGFVYTQTNDRLWRKNRQTVAGNSCVGRDINRNWPFRWEVTGGASTNPCSQTYKGQSPGDAPENRGLVSNIQGLRDGRGIALYVDFHSYGQYILWAYGFNCNTFPSNNAALRTVASAGASAIANAGANTRYTIGPSCSTLYPTTGSSVDYIAATGRAEYSYTIELRDRGNFGFVLPANQIRPTAIETWAGVRAMLSRI